MSSRSRWIVLVLALAGLAFATASAWVHYKVLTDPTYVSPCNLSESFNCSQVYLSQYGSVAGVPVALFGVFWFGLVALVAWGSAPATAKAAPPSGAALFVLSLIGVGVVLYLGLTSWFVLKTACVLCLGTYVAVIGIFITVARSKTVSFGESIGRSVGEFVDMTKKGAVAPLVIVLLAITGLGAVKFPREGAPAPMTASAGIEGLPQSAIDDFARVWAQLPRIQLGVPADGAKVVIVKFNDFQCPPCGATNSAYKPILEKFERTNAGAVKYVLKDWPWNSKCNFTLRPDPAAGHPGACEAAAAARMARDRGHDAEMNMREWLYSHQSGMDPATVKGAAESLLGVKDFAAEYEQKLPGIREDISLGAALRIQGTPTYFINGVRMDQIMPPAYFELAIQLELNRK